MPEPSRTGVLPDFIIVGAMKAGTTSLAFQLGHHPEIAMPDRELHYFYGRKYEWGPEWYRRQFEELDKPDARIYGEKTPTYGFAPPVAERIHAHNPKAKIIWSFRNPVDRTYSNYLHRAKRGAEPLSFERAIARRDPRLMQDYLRRSRYLEQVERFLEFFPREQTHFVIFEDLVDPEKNELDETLRFLGVDPVGFTPPQEARNVTVLPHSKKLLYAARQTLDKRIYRRVSDLLFMGVKPGYPPMKPATRRKLVEMFREDNERLSRLIGRDLSSWNA